MQECAGPRAAALGASDRRPRRNDVAGAARGALPTSATGCRRVKGAARVAKAAPLTPRTERRAARAAPLTLRTERHGARDAPLTPGTERRAARDTARAARGAGH